MDAGFLHTAGILKSPAVSRAPAESSAEDLVLNKTAGKAPAVRVRTIWEIDDKKSNFRLLSIL